MKYVDDDLMYVYKTSCHANLKVFLVVIPKKLYFSTSRLDRMTFAVFSSLLHLNILCGLFGGCQRLTDLWPTYYF